jgi:hypothetical protein
MKSLSCGSPKGCAGARATPSLHDKVLQEFWIGSKMIYFRNLGWTRLCEIRPLIKGLNYALDEVFDEGLNHVLTWACREVVKS